MKKSLLIFTLLSAFFLIGCEEKKQTADEVQAKQTETAMKQANLEVGMPSVTNFQEKKNLKWIYELCDKEEFICHAYLFNSMTGEVGQYLGECIGYGIPYSTQFSNPSRISDDPYRYQSGGKVMPQPEPNGLFKPEGLSATWLIMVDPTDKKPRPVYIEPEIIVSPFKLHK